MTIADALEDAAEWLNELAEDGPDLRPAYRVTGDPIPKVRTLELSGYPGATPQTGNDAVAQFQLDAFGEALQLFAAAAKHGVLTPDGEKATDIACAAIRLPTRSRRVLPVSP